jgi:hypothetical protein
LDSPPAFINSPASRKKGMASSVKVLAPVTICWLTICALNMPIHDIITMAQNISAKATGTPSASPKNSVPRKTTRITAAPLSDRTRR